MGIRKNQRREGAIRRLAFWDLKAVARMERASYNTPWTQEELEELLTEPTVEGWGLFVGGVIWGYAVIRYRTRHAFIETITVDPAARRERCGTQLIGHLYERAARRGSRCLVLEVHETNLGAQQFAVDLGFQLLKVMHRRYDDDSDAYLFTRRLRASQTA